MGFPNTSYISSYTDALFWIINYVFVPVLFALAFLIFLYGVAQAYIFSRGDAARISQGHKLILWGLIGFVVMLSVWGLVNILVNTLGLGSGVHPNYPTI